MRKQKIKAGSFQDRAEHKARKLGRIDLKKLWNMDKPDKDEELDPEKVKEIIDEA